MTTAIKTTAQQLRSALKTKGITSRQVSVRQHNFSDVKVTIKSQCSYHTVQEIASGFRRIHRCELTGEILCGANIFINIGFCSKFEKELGSKYLPHLEAAINDMRHQITENGSGSVDLTETCGVIFYSTQQDNHWKIRSGEDFCETIFIPENNLYAAENLAKSIFRAG